MHNQNRNGVVANIQALMAGLFLLLCLTYVSSADALTLYVATNGNDSWSGSLQQPTATRTDGPLASLTGARDKIRQIKASKQFKTAITVVIADGTYTMSAPLTLEPKDSGTTTLPIRFQAATGAHPVFSGGRAITGWSQGSNGIWWTDVPAVGNGSWYFEQLWVNGRRANRASATNDMVPYTLAVAEQRLGTNSYQQTITVAPQELQLLSGISASELANVSFVAFHKWNTTRRFVYALDTQAGTITIRSTVPMPSNNPITKYVPYYLENFYAALDTPGEWFLSRSGRIYYMPRPGEDMNTAKVIAPVTAKFMTMTGNAALGSYVENISFSGLSFQHSQWLTPTGGIEPMQSSAADASIMVQGARNIKFSNCEVLHTGNYAFAMWQGTRDSSISHCLMEDLGAGGVRIGDAYAAKTSAGFTKNVTVDNNIIRHGGRVSANAVGVWIGQSGSNHVTHNEIADFFYSGISAGWTWGYGYSAAVSNEIAYNHVHHLGWRLLSDMGGIYTLGVSTGTTVKNNVIHDVYAFNYGGWGLYMDEGSSYITATNNLVYNNLSAGYHLHYGQKNVVRNNIFADNWWVQLQRTRVELQNSVSLTNNIFYWKTGALLYGQWDTPDVTFSKNLYFDASGKAINFANMTFSTWQSGGRDAGSIIADPMFYDPAKGDYDLQSSSPALSIGFVPFDSSLAGVYGDMAWLDLAAREQYAQAEIPPALPSYSHMRW